MITLRLNQIPAPVAFLNGSAGKWSGRTTFSEIQQIGLTVHKIEDIYSAPSILLDLVSLSIQTIVIQSTGREQDAIYKSYMLFIPINCLLSF